MLKMYIITRYIETKKNGVECKGRKMYDIRSKTAV